MIEKYKREIICFFEGLIIAAFVITSLALPFSCTLNEEGIQIIGGDYSSPILEEFTVIDSKSLLLEFSEPVKVSGLVLTPWISGTSDSSRVSYDQMLAPSLAAASGEYGKIETTVEASEDGCSFKVIMSQESEVGQKYEVYGFVEDQIGNSLTFCLPFVGYNSYIPRLIMTEIQIKYGKGSSDGQTIYRGEYVEFLALESGNLAGLVLQGASDGSEKDYAFPPVEVQKGELILLHLRTVGDGCVNESGEDLNLATAPHSADAIRDLWSDNTKARFNDSSDVIILRDTVNDEIMDAIMYASADASEWKTAVGEYAFEVGESGIYDSSDISLAASSKGCTTLKALTRVDSLDILALINQEDEIEYDFPFHVDAESWAVAPVSPGRL